MATGCLSSANVPDFDGLERFKGACYHTGRWPHEGVDFTGQRVGVIGTGSSAVQSIPLIARQAAHLFVFQRTPNHVVPARNGPIDPQVREEGQGRTTRALRARAKQNRTGLPLPDQREVGARGDRGGAASASTRRRWEQGGLGFIGTFGDLLFNQAANDTAAEFIRRKIRETVRDPAVAAILSPRSVVGCKRLCIDSGYFETFNRPNVTLVDVSEQPIERITRATPSWSAARTTRSTRSCSPPASMR